jgi:hypothetical protein
MWRLGRELWRVVVCRRCGGKWCVGGMQGGCLKMEEGRVYSCGLVYVERGVEGNV